MTANATTTTEPSTPSFRDVFEKELSFVYNSLRRLGIREAELPDVTQEVFATVASILGDREEGHPFRARGEHHQVAELADQLIEQLSLVN